MFDTHRIGVLVSLVLAGAPGCDDENCGGAKMEASNSEAPAWPPTEEQTRANIAAAFERLSAGKYVEHVDLAFSPGSTLVIHGPQELGPGAFMGPEAIKKGFEGLFQAVPTHDFELHEMWVTTTADEVTAAVVWTDAAVREDGSALPSQGMNYIRLGPMGVIQEDIFITLDP